MFDAFLQNALTLSELNERIGHAIEDSLPGSYWVIAEIADLRSNQRGHCYMELVEKDNNTVIAQIRANIWAYDYRKLSSKFEMATGESLKSGMKILFMANITFHAVYGLSLNIKDIDPTYSLGDMARKKKEIIKRLTKEGVIDLNKSLSLPLIPQRIAVISSSTAAGYEDFIKHIEANPYGYRFNYKLFPALMQGANAEASIISALGSVKKYRHLFDVVVIIRGGGSQVDLNCFDSYELALEAARLPIPLITGIGHERDDTILDMVAHTKMKTPTAVAAFLISGMRSFEERIINAQRKLTKYTEHFIKDENHRLKFVIRQISHRAMQIIASNYKNIDIICHRIDTAIRTCFERKENSLVSLRKDLKSHIKQLFIKEDSRLYRIDHAVRYLDPVNVIKRGYSITYLNGKAVKDINLLKIGDAIHTKIYNGLITSAIQALEEINDEKKE
jgi:exodeoxyribonuclease VII large subunit